MKLQRLLLSLLTSGFLIVPTPPAAAQDGPAGNFALSSLVLKDGDVRGTFAGGWVAALAGRISPSWEIAGEIARSAKSVTAPRVLTGSRLTLYSLMIGPRWVRRQPRRAVPFVHALIGEVRLSSTLESCGIFRGTTCDATVGGTSVTPRLGIQSGGGVDIALNGRVGARLQGDYRLLLGEGSPTQLRVAGGLVVGL